eukprot:jgi/Mesvir1/852/Mv17425-RA.1
MMMSAVNMANFRALISPEPTETEGSVSSSQGISLGGLGTECESGDGGPPRGAGIHDEIASWAKVGVGADFFSKGQALEEADPELEGLEEEDVPGQEGLEDGAESYENEGGRVGENYGDESAGEGEEAARGSQSPLGRAAATITASTGAAGMAAGGAGGVSGLDRGGQGVAQIRADMARGAGAAAIDGVPTSVPAGLREEAKAMAASIMVGMPGQAGPGGTNSTSTPGTGGPAVGGGPGGAPPVNQYLPLSPIPFGTPGANPAPPLRSPSFSATPAGLGAQGAHVPATAVVRLLPFTGGKDGAGGGPGGPVLTQVVAAGPVRRASSNSLQGSGAAPGGVGGGGSGGVGAGAGKQASAEALEVERLRESLRQAQAENESLRQQVVLEQTKGKEGLRAIYEQTWALLDKQNNICKNYKKRLDALKLAVDATVQESEWARRRFAQLDQLLADVMMTPGDATATAPSGADRSSPPSNSSGPSSGVTTTAAASTHAAVNAPGVTGAIARGGGGSVPGPVMAPAISARDLLAKRNLQELRKLLVRAQHLHLPPQGGADAVSPGAAARAGGGVKPLAAAVASASSGGGMWGDLFLSAQRLVETVEVQAQEIGRRQSLEMQVRQLSDLLVTASREVDACRQAVVHEERLRLQRHVTPERVTRGRLFHADFSPLDHSPLDQSGEGSCGNSHYDQGARGRGGRKQKLGGKGDDDQQGGDATSSASKQHGRGDNRGGTAASHKGETGRQKNRHSHDDEEEGAAGHNHDDDEDEHDGHDRDGSRESSQEVTSRRAPDGGVRARSPQRHRGHVAGNGISKHGTAGGQGRPWVAGGGSKRAKAGPVLGAGARATGPVQGRSKSAGRLRGKGGAEAEGGEEGQSSGGGADARQDIIQHISDVAATAAAAKSILWEDTVRNRRAGPHAAPAAAGPSGSRAASSTAGPYRGLNGQGKVGEGAEGGLLRGSNYQRTSEADVARMVEALRLRFAEHDAELPLYVLRGGRPFQYLLYGKRVFLHATSGRLEVRTGGGYQDVLTMLLKPATASLLTVP